MDLSNSNYLSFKEAADFLNVTEPWLRSAVFKKKIPHIKFQRLIRFEMCDLLIWVDKSRVKEA